MKRKSPRGRQNQGRFQQYAWGVLEMGLAFLLTLSVVMGPRVYAWIKGDAETKARVDRFYQSLVTPNEMGGATHPDLRMPASSKR